MTNMAYAGNAAGNNVFTFRKSIAQSTFLLGSPIRPRLVRASCALVMLMQFSIIFRSANYDIYFGKCLPYTYSSLLFIGW